MKQAGRDTARTKQAILAGTARALIARGPAVSLDRIAAESGVSKGGILHHFGTKDELIQALAEDGLTSFRTRVHGHVDPADDKPGTLVRAYVRAVMEEVTEIELVGAPAEVWGVLGTIPATMAMLAADSDYWREALASDGLSADRVQIVWRAADGFALAASYDRRIDAAEIDRLGSWLIALTLPDPTE